MKKETDKIFDQVQNLRNAISLSIICWDELKQHDLGLCYLGDMYLRGLGTKQDYSKAFEYYSRAADLCNDIAEYNLGKIYEQGLGVEKD